MEHQENNSIFMEQQLNQKHLRKSYYALNHYFGINNEKVNK